MAKYKKRKDGRYLCQVLIGYQNNGKPKYKNLYGRSIIELDKKVTEFKSNMNKGILIDDKNITVGKWADIWLKTYKQNIGYNTYRRYESIINNQIKPTFELLKLSKLKLNDIQMLINQLSETYSASTVKKVKETLFQMCEQAIRNNLIFVNPVTGIQMPVMRSKKREPLTETLIDQLTFFCRNYSNGAFIMTLLYTGMRRGEIVALTWDDINFQDKTITINKAVEFKNNQAFVKPPKTEKGNRTIPILNLLEPYLKQRQGFSKKYVFTKQDGGMHSETSLRKMWIKFLKDFEDYLNMNNFEERVVAKLTMHQFRHTYATILYNAGVDVKTAQEFLGHSSINITLDIYTHLSQKIKNQGAEKLNNYLSSQSKISQIQ